MDLRIGGPQGITIALETAKQRQIPNFQSQEISPFEKAQFRTFEARFGDGVKPRTNPSPRYNCHGMTFASRRTGIMDNAAIHRILVDDEYVRVDPAEVMPGDLILYYDDDMEIEHSGVVVSGIPPPPSLPIPLVCSKWGKYSEVLHPASNCPYNFANARYYRSGQGQL